MLKNKGTGAGGANTNKNGLSYEDKTEINENRRYKVTETFIVKSKSLYKVTIDKHELIKVKKAELRIYMEGKNEYNKKEKSLQPDECYIDETNKVINIIEKKFQNKAGSVDEKIQTGMFKKEFYEDQYPNYTIKYCYCLSDWFKSDKYLPEMRFLKKYEVGVFWGSDVDYVDNILNWIISN
jgi:hypothetical protein